MTNEVGCFLVDSNILIYAYDIDEAVKQEKAKEFIKNNLIGENFVLSTQILAEFYLNVTEKIQKPIPAWQAREIILNFSIAVKVINYSAETILKASEIMAMHKIHFWDALIAATMKENQIETIFTENTKDFKKIPEITAINPLI